MSQDLAQQFDLTDKQAILIECIFQGKSVTQAKREAGYAETTIVSRMLRSSPAMAEAVDYELRRRLQFEAAPLAYKLLVDVVRDDGSKYGERVRVDAARTLLDRAGYLPPARKETGRDDKDPNDMTSDELHDAIEKLEREIADRARTVGSTSTTVDVEAELAEMA